MHFWDYIILSTGSTSYLFPNYLVDFFWCWCLHKLISMCSAFGIFCPFIDFKLFIFIIILLLYTQLFLEIFYMLSMRLIS
jgi:hypothetical protein